LRKGELIRRQDALMSLGFLLTGLRQHIMGFPHTLQRRLEGKTAHEIGEILRAECSSLLRDLAEWPQRVTSDGWGLDDIDEDLRPKAGNGDEDGGAARRAAVNANRERRNTQRREKYAKSKEG
jgi:hypothetical protein